MWSDSAVSSYEDLRNLPKGKTILITGGATGLGRAMAVAFGNLGKKSVCF